MENKINFNALQSFSLSVSYHDSHAFSSENEPSSHIHNQCEIYLNLSGDVSFIVDGHSYPISPGNVIITKPFEYHHCVYHSTLEHEHYCLQFSCDSNEDIYKLFFNRKKGQNNRIILLKEKVVSIRKHLDALLESNTGSSIDSYHHFFSILMILQNSSVSNEFENFEDIPQNLRTVLKLIDERYSTPLTVAKLASEIFVSVNTLERYFKKYMLISPSEYIKIKRLSAAVILMQKNTSTSEAAARCGFSDTSNFIATFKKHFGTTPYKYIRKNSSDKK